MVHRRLSIIQALFTDTYIVMIVQRPINVTQSLFTVTKGII